MSWLSLLFIVKITLTGILVVLPFLFFPKTKLEKTTSITTPTSTIFRLYGVAILALLVGYAFGIPISESNNYPLGIVCMGIVSNGGAAALLLWSRIFKHYLIFGFFFTLITLGLSATIMFPDISLQKAW